MTSEDELSFVLGGEKKLTELLSGAEVLPLLKAAVAAGASGARVVDEEGAELWSAGISGFTSDSPLSRRGRFREGEPPLQSSPQLPQGALQARLPLELEGEPVAIVELWGVAERRELLAGCCQLLRVALQSVVAGNLKRALTTEMHTGVVASSYKELLEANRALSRSEARYRELAEDLEVRVRERTAELRRAHTHLLQQEKMAAIGQLAAGVAHEINNPLGFITSNLHTLQKYVARFVAMLEFYRGHLSRGLAPQVPVPLPLEQHAAGLAAEAERRWRELKLPQVMADVGDLLSQSLSGAERVSRIVADLKGFSHLDESGEAPVDLNRELEATLRVLSHALAGRAEVVTDLQPLPPIYCLPQLPGQVFLNLIQNALTHGGENPTITVSSCFDGERIRFCVADDGPGIPPSRRAQIFEPFFTTLPVGSGTGMGLAVAWEAVLRMGGTIAVADGPAGGAEFVVTVPIPEG